MSDNIDVPCEMCGRYGCDPEHHAPMSKPRYRCCEHCADDSPHPATIGHGVACSSGSCPGVVRLATPPSSPASETEPTAGTGEQRRALLARQERYSEAVYGDGRGVTERVSDIMAIADDEIRAATKARPVMPPDLQRPTEGREARWLDALTLPTGNYSLEQCRVEIVSRATALADIEGAALWDRLRRARVTAERMTAEAVKDGALIADLQTGLADANATIERVQSLLGDTAGPLWSVRGVCEANLQAALNRRAQ